MEHELLAFVFIQTQPRERAAAMLLAGLSEVEELHRIAGEDCYVVRVRVSSTEELGRLIRDKIERIKSVHSTRTTLVLKTLKDKPPHGLKRPEMKGIASAR
ncbi:MAG TPA: Lrp/AsnC ligand binding domain-containing protein [Blastocatellia bacterium]|nr:Lrp/AsnC ligand binding domain-containing protein [Blastocatellia bacterium]